MPQSSLALIALAPAAACLLLCFRAFAARRLRLALLLIVVAGLLIRGYGASAGQLHAWDERYHALVAKNLRSDPWTPVLYAQPLLEYDYHDWQRNHVWLHKPPLALWLMAFSLRCFGVGESALRLPSVLLSTLAILLTYGIGRRLFCRRIGLLAAFLHCVNPLLLRLAAGRMPADHVDTALCFLVELGVWITVCHAERARRALLLAIGVVTGLAVLAKWLTGLLVLPLFFVLARRAGSRRRVIGQLALLSCLATLVVLPWEWHIGTAFPREAACERAYNWRHIVEPVEAHSASPFWHILHMPRYFGELAFIPAAWLIWTVLRRGGRHRSVILAWWGLPYLVFSLVATKMSNYVSVGAPAIFITQAHFWWCTQRSLPHRKHNRLWQILLVLLIVLPLKQSFSTVNPFRSSLQQPQWARDLHSLGERLPHGPVVLFAVNHPIEAMFYVDDLVAYDCYPTADQVNQLHRQGWRVLVVDAPELPAEIRAHPLVTTVALEPSTTRPFER
ncbi:MAG: glycosyltransferase family 39 protein [Planctomycetes bacterium]|nr:glycosyltransferase family 39 protein [Planctomycetota bacterium]